MKTLTQLEIADKLGVSIDTARRELRKLKVQPVGIEHPNMPLYPAGIVPVIEKRRAREAQRRQRMFSEWGRMAHGGKAIGRFTHRGAKL